MERALWRLFEFKKWNWEGEIIEQIQIPISVCNLKLGGIHKVGEHQWITWGQCSWGKDDKKSWILQFDTAGKILWEYRSTAPLKMEGRFLKIQVDSENNIWALEQLSPKELNFNQIGLTKFTSEGKIIWREVYPNSGSENGESLYLTPDGGVYILGDFAKVGDFQYLKEMNQGLIRKIDPNGDVVWTKTWGSGLDDVLTDLILEDNGQLILAGESHSSLNDRDIWFLKLDAQGNLIFEDFFYKSFWECGLDCF